ncbi:hypothetical protein RRG08_002632 [Elysia crispata]|uniref:Cytochrome P450 n=1 Tax=Elysia crispata TaxID=231223 RepID=A0AAE0Y4Q6_9GAST|nr:hypothetical protein RRG08_002632 [Elysia crispata]
MVFQTLLGFDPPTLVIVAVTLLVILVVSSWTRTPANLPPCPVRPFPVLGHLAYMSKDPRGVIMDWSKQTGDIFSLYFGTTLVIVISGYDVLKETLVKQADIFSDRPKTGMFPILKTFNGIINTSGPLWKENRSTVLSILRTFGMGKNVMAEKIEEEVHAYLEEIKRLGGKPADIKEITCRAVSNVICNFLLGKRFEYNDSYYLKFLKMFDQTVASASAGSLHKWFPSVQYIPGDPFKTKQVVVNRGAFDNFAQEFIEKVEDNETGGINRDNIIAYYLREMREKHDKGQSTHLSDEGLMRVISDFMIAGSETTTSTILWFFLYMLHNPDVQRKIHEEIDEEIGTDRNPKITDRSKLTYVNAAIMETQRAASIVPLGLFHTCIQETSVRGYTIPKDTLIMTHLDGVLLSEQLWGDPQNFRPERFIDEKGNLQSPDHFVAFSMGRRLCLGEALAKAELFLFITYTLQKYRVVPEDPDSLPPFDSILGITRAPKPHKLRLVKRDAAMD